MGGVGNEEGLFRGKAGNEEVEEGWWRGGVGLDGPSGLVPNLFGVACVQLYNL
jgi:hypothetical protein